MTKQKLTESIQHKLMLRLLQYDYSIEYKKGVDNKAADALSKMDHSCHAIPTVTPLWITEVAKTYAADPQCQQLLTQLAIIADPTSGYSLHSGVLRYKGRIHVGADTTVQNKIISSLHSSAIGGHSGIAATYQRIKKLFHWLGIKKSVEVFVNECATCQRAKGEHCHYPGLLNPLPIPDMAWEHITMDFVEGLPKSNGKDVVLVVVDRLSKYVHFIALSHPFTAKQIANIFMDNVFKLHGLPKVMISDRDRVFTSDFWQEVFKTLKVTLRLSSAYHPQSDGQTERVNQCMESYLRCMAFSEPKRWSFWLPLAEWWYNTSFHTSLKLTPFQALYGFPPPMINEVAVPGPDSPAADFLTEKQNMITRLKENLAHA
uniref:Integrase catalytic domain-containing protein n=1 Tax=Arundo donax TaxID=35708 RepID=A0A0A9FY82_ARUDO